MAASVMDGAVQAALSGEGGKGKGKSRPPPPPKAKAKPRAEQGYNAQLPEGKNVGERKMPPLPKPAAEEALVAIAKLQCDDGSWQLSDELAGVLGLYPSALALSPTPTATVPSWDRLVATSTARQALERCRSILAARGSDRDETLSVAGAASVLGSKLLDAAIDYLDAKWKEVSECKHLLHLYARQRFSLDMAVTKLLDQQLPRPDWQAQLRAKMSVHKTCDVCGSSYTAAVGKCLVCFPPELPAEPERRKVEEQLAWQKLPSAPISVPLDWSQPEGMKPCEGGSGGVALFKLPQGVVAVKPQKMTAAAEFLAIQVAKAVAVPVADIRVVRWVDQEYASIHDTLRSVDPNEEQGLNMLKLRLHHRNCEFFGILEYIPGIGVQGQELHERLQAMQPHRLDAFWYQVGEIVAFDALINNVDRVPLLWDNEGNTANLMLREDAEDVAVVGIDQAVTAIVAQGPGRDRYAGRLRLLAEGLFTGSWQEKEAQGPQGSTRGGAWSIGTGMAHVSECFQLSCGATIHWKPFMDGVRFRLNFIADLVDNGTLRTALDEATAAADEVFRAATVDVGFRQLPKMQDFLMEMASIIAETRYMLSVDTLVAARYRMILCTFTQTTRQGLIKTYEEEDHEPWGAYGFALNHKHLPEMARWTGLQEEPIFCPAVGDFKQGSRSSGQAWIRSLELSGAQQSCPVLEGTTASDVHAAMAAHYEGCLRARRQYSFAGTWHGAERWLQAQWAPASQVEGDVHSEAVQKWLDSMIIGLSFCPWAKPASEAGGIRIVTSMAKSPADALEDLKAEAARLQGAPGTTATTVTTLLVCPGVKPWEDFAEFNAFRETELGNGEALVKEFGCKVVCFHPHSRASDSYGLQEGDEIVIRREDGEQLCGTILSMAQGEEGDSILRVQFYGKVDQGNAEDGEFGMQPFADSEDHVDCVPEESVLQLLGREALQEEDACRSILGRAPRIVLHLLRAADLEAVDNQKAFETLERNEQVVESMGEEEFDRRVHECG
ncbi:argC [Symbiodinium natans]|uniref:ArgC protein n=1 Tax=Symbiodinium natans TaxID=878477 RepID=A0A812GIX9_9DINO|nr:argC [Symbiodinium natans]